MRRDGRKSDELRPVRLEPDFTQNPLGSVLCRVGSTLVLCTVCEEPAVPRFLQGSGRGWITAEYSMLPGSTDRRGDREVARGRASGRTMEIQRLIGRSLRAVADLAALDERSPLRDSVAAVSVGIVDGEVVLDLPYEEDARADVDMNVVATGQGRLVEVQGTGEEATFTPQQLAEMTALALRGTEALAGCQQQAVTQAGEDA